MSRIERTAAAQSAGTFPVGAASTGQRLGQGFVALGFAVAFIVVFVTPPFTPWQFAPYDLMRWGDVIDLVTPVVMLPMYWLLFTYDRKPLARWEIVTFLVLGAVWVEGHGTHLAANSIGHLVESGPGGELTNFYDERLGHILWHGAALALSGLVALRALQPAQVPARGVRMFGLAAALVYGFAFFLIAVEGGTAVLALAGGAIVTAIAASNGLGAMLSRPRTALFGIGYPVMALLLAIWFIYWGGSLPEFSKLGFIK